jgi:hypothetical protein
MAALKLGTTSEFIEFVRQGTQIHVFIREKACPETKNKPSHCEFTLGMAEAEKLAAWLQRRVSPRTVIDANDLD